MAKDPVRDIPPHPRREPRYPGPITAERLEEIFRDCVDYTVRPVVLGGGTGRGLTLCYLGGMVRMERVSDYLLKPLARDGSLAGCTPAQQMTRMEQGALYNLGVARRHSLDQVVSDLVAGWCVLLFPGESAVLSCFVGTEEKRSVSAPDNETVLKGARDGFVESVRTNTSIVRRHLKTAELRIQEQVVGRQSQTLVDLLYIEGLTNPHLVEQLAAWLKEIDIDGVFSTGAIEEYIVPAAHTPFPLVQYTQRSDKFCAGLAQGRVGLFIDGIPLGYLAPAVLGNFLQAPQDKSSSWMLATVLTVLRYFCMLTTLILPALYVAMVTFHQEMIPTRLALSIIAAKENVPFRSGFEVIVLLLAFEILQEAGLRLPQSIGQTVSIIGGLVVGSAAVEAKIVSPAVLIVVAIAGIAGYTMPSQELGGALRIWRFVLVLLSIWAGLFGVILGAAALIIHLAGLESFGVPYLTPFAVGTGLHAREHVFLRRPMPEIKLRPSALKPRNRRKQR